MRPRFSLRALFLLTTIAALGCYWLVLPSLVAQRFLRAVKSADYQEADACFRNLDDGFLSKWHEEYWYFTARVSLQPWSFEDVVRGRRRLTAQLAHGGPSPVRIKEYTVTATRSGLSALDFIGGEVGTTPVDSPTIPADPIS